MSAISLISNTGYILANKSIANKFGLDCAVLLGELASEYAYYEAAGKLSDDGSFFSTVENVKENTTLSENRQRRAINLLEESGILECKRKGIPAKRFIKINEKALLESVNNNLNIDLTSSCKMQPTSSGILQELDPVKCRSNNNKYKNNKERVINNNTLICSSDDEPKKKDVSKSEIESFFKSVWKLYPKKRGLGQVSQSAKKALCSYGYEQVERAINRYLGELRRTGKEEYMKNGSTFFNSGIVDYLDDNYEELPGGIKGGCAVSKKTDSSKGIDFSKIGTTI